MPKFSKMSEYRLSTCHPDLQVIFNKVIEMYDCTVIEGYRGRDAQEKAFRAGKSKVQYPFGKHNSIPSKAVDVSPYPIPPWSKSADFVYFGGVVMGIASMLKQQGIITHGIRYGNDWNMNLRVTDETFADACHFELTS